MFQRPVRRLARELLFPARAAGFVGLTFGMYGLLELDSALAGPGRGNEILGKWVERYGRALLSLYGVRVLTAGPHLGARRRYPGRDRTGRGRIFVMNHRSGLDIVVDLAFVDATLLSRADLADWPVIGPAARRVGTLFVDRESRASGAEAVQQLARAVTAGRGVMVYPEGTTFAGDDVRPLKAGPFRAAQRTGAEIVPVGIAYEEGGSVFGDEAFLAHMRRVSATPRTRVGLVAGAPIVPGGEDASELRERTRDALQALVTRARTLLADRRQGRRAGAAG